MGRLPGRYAPPKPIKPGTEQEARAHETDKLLAKALRGTWLTKLKILFIIYFVDNGTSSRNKE